LTLEREKKMVEQKKKGLGYMFIANKNDEKNMLRNEDGKS